MSIAYLDPGNLEADLQSGAAAGYSLLWLLLYAHIAGLLIQILFGFPLWFGTLLTAMDTFTFMLLQNYGVRKLEAFFMTLIALMAICFWIEMFQSEPNVGGIVKGMLIPTVPSSAV